MPTNGSSTFIILPAIDLRAGRVVRLRQGDFSREQVYADHPSEVGRGFAGAGAAWIHVVDLDGALAGEPRQTEAIRAIIAATSSGGPRIEVAGGLRSMAAIDTVLGAGADRVVIGTAALRDPAVVAAACERHGAERVAVALDVRDGQAVGDGWIRGAAGVSVVDALDGLTKAGVATFVVTAIDRDGLLGGPDVELLRSCVTRTSAAIIASGGIRSIADLEAVRHIGCSGAIVGRAIYDGGLDLRAAITALARPS